MHPRPYIHSDIHISGLYVPVRQESPVRLPEESHLLKNNDEFFFPGPDATGLLPQGSAPHILLHPAYAVLSEDFP